jgi:hypothetical protein
MPFDTKNNYPDKMAIRDVNGDKRLDIVVVASGSVNVLFNQSQ